MFGWLSRWFYHDEATPEREAMVTDCPYCGKPVTSYWRNGCISMPEKYILVADWIFHAECWNLQVMTYEMEEEKYAASDGRTEGEVGREGRRDRGNEADQFP